MQVGEQGGMLEIVYIDSRIGWIGILGILSILLSDLNYPDYFSQSYILQRLTKWCLSMIKIKQKARAAMRIRTLFIGEPYRLLED